MQQLQKSGAGSADTITALTTRVGAAEAEVRSLRADNTQLAAANKGLQQQVSNLQQQLQEVSLAFSALAQKVQDLSSSAAAPKPPALAPGPSPDAALVSRVAAAEASVSSLSQQVADLRSAQGQAKSSLDSLSAAVTDIRSTQGQQKAAVDGLVARERTSNTTLADVRKVQGQLQASVTSLTSGVQELRTQAQLASGLLDVFDWDTYTLKPERLCLGELGFYCRQAFDTGLELISCMVSGFWLLHVGPRWHAATAANDSLNHAHVLPTCRQDLHERQGGQLAWGLGVLPVSGPASHARIYCCLELALVPAPALRLD